MPTMTAAQKKRKYRIVCTHCGSDDVVVDAWAEWDAAEYRWRVAEVFDSTAHCRNCDGECSIRTESMFGQRSVRVANRLLSLA